MPQYTVFEDKGLGGDDESATSSRRGDIEDDEDSDVEEVMHRDAKFEFSDSYKIMRLIKMLLLLQVLGILIDNPSIKISILFDIICRGPLFYSIRFYSRPFIDLLYLVWFFLAAIVTFFEDEVPASPDSENTEVSSRRFLIANVTVVAEEDPPIFINFLDPESWHGVKIFSHYFLGMFFAVMAVLFTVRFWEISDFTNRGEVRNWLNRYVYVYVSCMCHV